MNNKKAKALRKSVEQYNGLPDVAYKVVNRQTKQYRNLLGEITEYNTATIEMIECKRKTYKMLKKASKIGGEI